ncbi:MAG: cytochrome c-type biogenesis protein CcmH [Rhodospirillaceae bacterium]|jgi:cytochrome c-type biogenesis protein CcmH|nr:cytochrome c-type biogenesis protein CcmH [Rhodospirillaceae bacterium]MBT3926335.1 cytochrome c-type biogenesis protein CcmH [Rhodospirillaceae bacterium]MBT4428413.1 cytochrome c-type biogenesis protein CcmH [Rhodospirillaceae bacterium]MBT5040185.1 cytochrome c-type biogenesis protein CcmH [Rhodospirillaceae bacterium]MBT5674189.1 cytochrome c-type biogenesis protein CcmH [Rhodospirillaceae bacterium]
MRAALLVATVLLLTLLGSGAWAFSADDALDDPVLEARALKLHDELRCPVCQGQAISDSNAELARDLRRIVRERVAAGDSDDAVFDYLSDRYGDFILLRPRVKPTNYVLWFGPALVFIVGVGGLWMFVRRRRGPAAESAPTPLSEAERKELESLSRDDPQ